MNRSVFRKSSLPDISLIIHLLNIIQLKSKYLGVGKAGNGGVDQRDQRERKA